MTVATAIDTIEIVRELLRRAILTLAAIPDPDLRYRTGPRTAWPAYVQETRDAYASAPPRVRTFAPSQHDISIFIEVLNWLNWYRRQNRRAEENVRLFTAWVFGAPIWMLQQRCSTNRRLPASKTTVYERLDRVPEAVAERFHRDIRKRGVDKLNEVDQKWPPTGDLGACASSDLNDLPTSPKHYRGPGAKPRDLNASERAAMQKIERESERRRARANRRKRANRQKKNQKFPKKRPPTEARP